MDSSTELKGWVSRFQRHFNEIVMNTLVAGIGVFIFSNVLLFGGINFFPDFFINYISPEFNSDGSLDLLLNPRPVPLQPNQIRAVFRRARQPGNSQQPAMLAMALKNQCLTKINQTVAIVGDRKAQLGQGIGRPCARLKRGQ